jgi:5-methylcytosine-specific restriction endonuclease McrA
VWENPASANGQVPAREDVMAMNERQRKKRLVRRNAVLRLPALLKKQKFRCHWCGGPIVSERALNRSGVEIIEKTPQQVLIYIFCGKKVSCPAATVDHLEPLADNLNRANKKSNLVAACFTCNQERDKKRLAEAR